MCRAQHAYDARGHVVLSQALGIVGTALVGLVSVCTGPSSGGLCGQRAAQLLGATGTIVMQWESLLSTWGSELGMLEDVACETAPLRMRPRRLLSQGRPHSSPPVASGAVQQLATLEVTCTAGPANAVTGFARLPPDPANRDSPKLRLTLSFEPASLAWLRAARGPSAPPVVAMGGDAGAVSLVVRAFLFTQGINEQQTAANFLTNQDMQDAINKRNLAYLQRFIRDELIASGTAEEASVWELGKLGQDLSEAVTASMGVESKRPVVLTAASRLTNLLGAFRVTMCKSGKVRIHPVFLSFLACTCHRNRSAANCGDWGQPSSSCDQHLGPDVDVSHARGRRGGTGRYGPAATAAAGCSAAGQPSGAHRLACRPAGQEPADADPA